MAPYVDAPVAPADPVTQPDAHDAEPPKPSRFANWRARRAINRQARLAMRLERAVAPRRTEPQTATLDAVDWARWYPALMWFAAGVVLVTFVLSYHGLYEFAAGVVHLPTELAILVPVGVDVFSLCCLAATFLTRDAHWRVRLYCWSMFGFTVAVSIAGNAVYAVSDVQRRASDSTVRWGYLQFAAVIGAALWPVFSAGALHLLIVVRRHMERQRDKIKTAVAQAHDEADEEERQQARALVLAAEGATVPDILVDLGLGYDKRRTVERWTRPIRDAVTAPKPVAPAKAAPRRVNGREGR